MVYPSGVCLCVYGPWTVCWNRRFVRFALPLSQCFLWSMGPCVGSKAYFGSVPESVVFMRSVCLKEGAFKELPLKWSVLYVLKRVL